VVLRGEGAEEKKGEGAEEKKGKGISRMHD